MSNLQNNISIDFFDATPKTLEWSGTTFNESTLDNGSIDNQIDLTLWEDKFSQTGLLTENTDFTTANVPSGLSVVIDILDTIHATIQLTGNALSHLESDDINNMEISFEDVAFVGGVATDIANYSHNDIIVDFIDLPNDSTDFLTYSFDEQTGPATIDYVNHSITIEVDNTADITDLTAFFTLSTDSPTSLAIVSKSGSLPVSWRCLRIILLILLIVSIICIGILIVLAWSAMALLIACRIHHVA